MFVPQMAERGEVTVSRAAERIEASESAEILKLPTKPSEVKSAAEERSTYAQFVIPDSFILLVQKSANAIGNLRKELAPGSAIRAWLDRVEKDITQGDESYHGK
jgi:hypothetical protein